MFIEITYGSCIYEIEVTHTYPEIDYKLLGISPASTKYPFFTAEDIISNEDQMIELIDAELDKLN
jgi:hypothetical protein